MNNTTKYAILFASVLAAAPTINTGAQSKAVSAPAAFHIDRKIVPPYLSVDSRSVFYLDADKNNTINANETSSVNFTIVNSGKGDAYNCSVIVEPSGSTSGITCQNQQLGTIKAGSKLNVKLPIQANYNTQNGEIAFRILVKEPNGFDPQPILLNVKTHKFDAPSVEIVSHQALAYGSNPTLQKKRPFKLQIMIQNTDQGVAKDVKCSFNLPKNMFLVEGETSQQIATLLPNETKTLEYELQTNSSISDNVVIPFHLSESYGKYAKDAKIELHFGQSVSNEAISVQVAGANTEEITIQRGSLISSVDQNIPVTNSKNNNTFVVIIANENYQQVAKVPFALNDGNIFHQYCVKTLGISEKHIKHIPNATLNNIRDNVGWLKNMTEAWDNANIIFYYTGHGIPDESSRTAYLLPVDGSGSNVSTGYKLDELYATLGNLPAERITIFMDACFSGAKRDGQMLASAKGVALKAKAGVPKGNMVVFSASQADETASFYNSQKHGLFTYYLLKELQDTKGDIELQTLGNNIITQVRRTAMEENGKPQTPTVVASSEVGNSWKNWKLK